MRISIFGETILAPEARAFPTIESLPKSLSCQHALIRKINDTRAFPRALPEDSCEVFELCPVVSPAVVSAVYQIAAVNPVTGGRARRRKAAAAGEIARGKSGALRGRTERGFVDCSK